MGYSTISICEDQQVLKKFNDKKVYTYKDKEYFFFENEKDATNFLFNHPEVIGKGFTSLYKEYRIGNSIIDLVIRNNEGRVYLVEVKLNNTGSLRKAEQQLFRYYDEFNKLFYTIDFWSYCFGLIVIGYRSNSKVRYFNITEVKNPHSSIDKYVIENKEYRR